MQHKCFVLHKYFDINTDSLLLVYSYCKMQNELFCCVAGLEGISLFAYWTTPALSTC